MKKLLILVVFFFSSKLYSQQTLSDKTIIIRKYLHPSINGAFVRVKKIKNYRTLSFDARFNSNCDYNLGNSHQKSWSKLMKISPSSSGEGKRHSNRLGWRYNLDPEKIELAMLLHLNHPVHEEDPSKKFWFPIHSTDLNVFNEVELIFDDALMVTTVEDKSVIMKEQFFTNTYKTGVRRNAYFGGQQSAPQDMSFRVENIKVDFPPSRFKQSDEKHFFRCKFYNGENLSYYAEDKIIAASYNSEARPKHSFFTVESGSDVTLISANEIVLDSNTHIQAGASFHAKIENCSEIEVSNYPTTICNGDNLNFIVSDATTYNLHLQTIYGQSVYQNSGAISGNSLSVDIPNVASANYRVWVTFEGPCDIKPKLYYVHISNCTPPLANARIYTPPVDSSSVVEPPLEIALSIYPNPTHDHIQVLGSETGEYVLTDLSGRELLRGEKVQRQMSLDLSDLPNGVYIFILNGQSHQLLKQ